MNLILFLLNSLINSLSGDLKIALISNSLTYRFYLEKLLEFFFLSLSLKKAKNEHRPPISLGPPVTKFYRDSNKKKTFVKRITLAKMAADILEHVL